MNEHPKEIIQEQLNRPQTTKQFAWLLGVVDNECYLVSRGVRNVALISPLWPTSKHKSRYPILKRIAKAAKLDILAVPQTMGGKDTRHWSYFIYAKTARQKVERIIRLQDKLTRMGGGIKNPQARAVHRKIGKLFGYGRREVDRFYGEG